MGFSDFFFAARERGKYLKGCILIPKHPNSHWAFSTTTEVDRNDYKQYLQWLMVSAVTSFGKYLEASSIKSRGTLCIQFYETTYLQCVENSWGYKIEGTKFKLSGYVEELMKKRAGVQPVHLPYSFEL